MKLPPHAVLALVFLCLLALPARLRADPLAEALIYHTYFSGPTEVKRLLDKGANPNATDSHGWTALAIAADRTDANATPIAALLLQKGADANRAKERNYPLINAIKNNNVSLVSLLLQHNANIRIRDAKGTTPLALARSMENPSIIYFLEKKIFEERQLQIYLGSRVRLRQIMEKFTMGHCQFEYWRFYVKSKQDKNMNEALLMRRLKDTMKEISLLTMQGSPYFSTFRDGTHNTIATNIRTTIYNELNGMISNRNRRENGVGTEADAARRCGKITGKILTSMQLQR